MFFIILFMSLTKVKAFFNKLLPEEINGKLYVQLNASEKNSGYIIYSDNESLLKRLASKLAQYGLPNVPRVWPAGKYYIFLHANDIEQVCRSLNHPFGN